MGTILVTGGHGFVGSHIVGLLLARGDRVRCLHRRSETPEALRGLDVDIVRGDVRDAAALAGAVAGVDEIYHLAALTRSRTRREMLATNTIATRALLDAAWKAGVTGRFLFCSSLAAAGPSPSGAPLDEASPCRPVTWYGESKALAERVVREYADRLPCTIVRPPAVYGPRDTDLLPVFKAAQRGILPILGLERRLYNFIYAGDLAQGMLAAATSPRTVGRTYFVTHPQVLTAESFARHAARAVGRRARPLRIPESTLGLVARLGDLGTQVAGRAPLLNGQRMRELSGRAYLASSAALARDTGFRATIRAERGTVLTVAWYRAHGWLPPAPAALRRQSPR